MMTTLERMPLFRGERWEPFRDFDEMSQRMRRIFEETMHGLPELGRDALWAPHFDLVEGDDAYLVEIELPGLMREEIHLELIGNELVCHGEVKEREHEGVLRRQTRRTGTFRFTAVLAEPVDAEKVEATLADGVLKVRAPKAEPAAHRTIEVKAA